MVLSLGFGHIVLYVLFCNCHSFMWSWTYTFSSQGSGFSISNHNAYFHVIRTNLSWDRNHPDTRAHIIGSMLLILNFVVMEQVRSSRPGPRFGRVECDGEDCPVMGHATRQLFAPVPVMWDPALCNAPCCAALCPAPASTAEGTCGSAYHRGRRIFGRALFQLWTWRRGVARNPGWQYGARAFHLYHLDLVSLALHPLSVQSGPPNSAREDIGACTLAIGMINRCTLDHVDCDCSDLIAMN